jgi:phage shock protein A
MADTLRTRVARLIAGGAHAFINKIEDAAPVAMLEQSVREIERVTDDVRAELGRVAASRHLAQQQHVHLNQEHETLSAALVTAIAGRRDELAKPAIARQLDIEAQLPILEASLAQFALDDKELSGFVDALMGKKREMERAIIEFEQSRKIADSALTDHGQASGASTPGVKAEAALSAFDRIYERTTGLDRSGRNATMAQATQLKALTELVRDNKINERLAALKAQQ